MEPLRVALAQINVRVGDLRANAAKIREHIARAREQAAEVVLFPELAVSGYPPEDLLLKEHFLRDCRGALEEIAAEARDIVALVGFPERADDVYNALAVCAAGEVAAIYRKNDLPNYGVFDEQRYFQAGECGAVVELGDTRMGLTICEDIWTPGPPASAEALAGAGIVVNASASPYHRNKGMERERMIVQRARDNLCVMAFCNLVGGQDELVFDGHSLIVDHDGNVLVRAPQFAEALLVADVDVSAALAARLRDARLRPPVRSQLPAVDRLAGLPRRTPAGPRRAGEVVEPLAPEAEVYAALVTGTRDYVEKNGFQAVALGLSGGIDSTLVLLVAVDALGPDRVSAVVMPSRYSSTGTQQDARDLAANLGVRCIELPIEPAFRAYEEMLSGVFAGSQHDLTEENLQARIRGNLLMALSNKFGWLILTTGNKSETSVGYSTLYGDTAGGFAVIKDVPKTLVYTLVEHRNDGSVPQSIIDRAPSAELRADQRDEDSLPPYPTLDPIIEKLVEYDLSREQLALNGVDPELVERVARLIELAEYKRRQQPPGVKITPRAFGRDRRIPITNAYRG